ncbi:MAG: response regulator [Chitinispirillales bacterium]|jgi:signal transduction histidine kinase/CheY-like chemotaxis protein|nr:response regulator [Chitinispirillales bacterium]
MKIIAILPHITLLPLLLLLSGTLLPGCGASGGGQTYEAPVRFSYRDVPGVTPEEIAAIAKLREQTEHFIYGMQLSTEMFFGEDGEIKGFTALFCDWLTNLFEIPFIPKHYEWRDLLVALENGGVDFTGDITATEARRSIYFMTYDIAKRPLKYFRIEGSRPLSEIAAYRPMRYGFVSGTITHNTVAAVSDTTAYEVVFIGNLDQVHGALASGEIDAFFHSGPIEINFDHYGDVVSEFFLPLAYIPVSLVASMSRPELEPIISVVHKILQNDGLRSFIELYNQGYSEYLKHKLRARLTDEERTHIQNNPTVRFVAEYDNYPVSFYNVREKAWQGIAFDVIAEVETLTGLEFGEPVNGHNTEWHELYAMLKNGEVSMITELIRLPEREAYFHWPNNTILTNQYALLSKSQRNNIRINEIMFTRVGLIRDVAYTAVFQHWFPNHTNTVFYESVDAAFKALENDEVEMVMATIFHLLAQTNYRELPGFKANVVFNGAFNSTFGFNINEEILCSIVDKALSIVDVELITGQWLRKTYDYREKVVQARIPWLISAIVLSLITLTLVSILFARSRNAKRKLEIQVEQRTHELRLQTEKANSASRAKSAFLANMSHEIRTPMNSFMGFAELAMDKTIEPQIEDYLGKITDSTRWLLGIINDILDISKIEAGKMELENVPFNLQDIIMRCQSVILPELTNKGLELELHVDSLVDKKLLGDPLRLYQVIMNLLSNAVKFTNAGTIKFSSSVKNLDNGKTTVYFEVKDSGIGMSGEQAEKIFAPFIQADSSTTRNYGGTGLGLTIAKNMIELMGGKLSMESTPGIGSTFSFEITFETIDASSGDVLDNGDYEIVGKPHFNGLVLICDDNPMNREVVCEHLARVGLSVVAAMNGKIAVETVQERVASDKKPFDMIFMDIFMPVMDGIEAATKITALNTGTPIVAMTANVMANELDNYRKHGMPDYLGKPFTSQELWRVLLRYLTPISSSAVDDDEQARDKDELLKKLRINFVKSNQTTYDNIANAIESNDVKLAHRLAHTLKGSAGMIDETMLQKAAAKVEDSLKNGKNFVSDEKMNILKKELTFVLEGLKPMLDTSEKIKKTLNPEEISALFEKLEPMLVNINPGCVNMLDDLRAIPEMEKLVRQIENYEFDFAAETLAKLKKKYTGGF